MELARERPNIDSAPLLRRDFVYKSGQTILTYMLESPFWLWHARHGTTWESLRYVAPAAFKAVQSRFGHKNTCDPTFEIPRNSEQLPLDEKFFRLLAKTGAMTGGAYEQALVNAIFPPLRPLKAVPKLTAAPASVAPPVVPLPVPEQKSKGLGAKRRRKKKREALPVNVQPGNRLDSLPRVFAAEFAAGGLDMPHMHKHHNTHFRAIFNAFCEHRLSAAGLWGRSAAKAPAVSDLLNIGRLVTMGDVDLWRESHKTILPRPCSAQAHKAALA